jgi:hypothetical protein
MSASRRLDQLRQEQKEAVGLNPGNLRRGLADNPRDDKPTLASQGIDKNLAQQGRVLGGLSDEKFEEVVADARDAINRVVKLVVNANDKAERRAEREADLAAKQTGCRRSATA